MKKLVMLMILAIIAMATAVNAATINVNMYATEGSTGPESDLVGPAGGSGETWNQFDTSSGSALLDSTGAVTSVGFSLNTGTAYQRFDADLTMLLASMTHFGKGVDTTMTITGLTPGSMYNVWIASSDYQGYDPETGHGEWSTSNPTTTVGVQAISNFELNGTTWEYGNNYVLFENVEANASGEIAFLGDATDVGEIDDYAYRLGLSGFQIQFLGTGDTVPDVVDMTQAAAQAKISEDGFTVGTITTAYSETIDAGNVISQSPSAGVNAIPGSAISLVISDGPPPLATVPDVVGLSQAQAESDLAAASLVAAVSTAYSDTVPLGNVVSQNPAGGASVAEGASVDIVVSLGKIVSLSRVINVNMYANDGRGLGDPAELVGPAGGLGETWNQFNTQPQSGLLDSTGAVTTVGYTTNYDGGDPWGDPDLDVLKAGRRHFGKGTDGIVTITGLTPGDLYDVWIASYADNGTVVERALGEWSTSNETTTDVPQMIDSRTTGLIGDTWTYGVNYVLFENVKAAANGEIALLGDAADGTPDNPEYGETFKTRLALSGFQIVAVDMTAATVRAGSNWVTWSEKPVTLDDVVVENNDSSAGDPTLTWSYEPVSGVTVDPFDVHAQYPTIKITKDPLTADVIPVKFTLTVTQVGKDPVESSMLIDVYDDACKAALGAGTVTIKPSDFNTDCVIGLEDLAEMASDWLVNFSLKTPVDK